MEAGKKRLAGDTAREATSDEVKGIRAEAQQLKELLAEVLLENRLLKKSGPPTSTLIIQGATLSTALSSIAGHKQLGY